MKKLEEVMRLVDHHVIIDCCHNPNPEPQDVPPVFQVPHNYTLYRNVGTLLGQSDENGFPVECDVCGSSYLIPRSFLQREFDKLVD